jgi:peptidoglycan/LPS O-acetylase OafA/YrhL
MTFIKEHFHYLTKPGKYPGVDILRAIAISLVLLYHFDRVVMGWIGVDLFFVISGFLIGGILYDQLKTDKWDLKTFYKNRCLRILPLYYFFILLCAISRPIIFGDDSPFGHFTISRCLKSLVQSLTFMQVAGPYYFPFHHYEQFVPGGTWSLTIEEIFYAIFPIVLFYLYSLCKKKPKPLLGLMVLLFASGIACRFLFITLFPPTNPLEYLEANAQFHARYDELIAGVVIALVIRIYPNISRFTKELCFTIGAFLLALFLTYYCNSPYYKTPQLMTTATLYFPTILGAAFALMTLAVINVQTRFIFVTFLARISYSLFLVHYYILELASYYLGYNRVAHIWLLALSIFCAYLLSLLVEYPFIKRYKFISTPAQATLPKDVALA